MTQFISRPLHACERVHVESFLTENLGFIEYPLSSNCGKLLDIGTDSYPQLIRMFYANLRVVKSGRQISLECQVKYTKFTLTESVLNTILDLPLVPLPTLSQNEARNKCLLEFANPYHQTHPAHLSYLVLQKDPRLLYYVLIRTILPKSNSSDSVNTKTLALIYLLMTGKPINFARYILGVIAKVGSIK